MSVVQRFSGRVAVVAGGHGGIGSAVVRTLQAQGARVAVLDRAPAAGSPALSVACDVTDPVSVAEAVQAVTAELGAPDLLVCAAGVVSEHDVTAMPPQEWHRVVDASLTGCFLVVREALPHLCQSERGSVVALSSGWATKGYPRGAHYAAAKAGVEAFVKSVALEVAGHGVRVNAVAPGPVLTPFLDYVDDLESWREQRAAAIPLGRVADPDDLVGPVLFLLSDDSRYVTGQVLHVNGGLLMP